MQPNTNHFVGASEACRLLKCSQQKLARLVSEGRIATKATPGRQKRYNVAAYVKRLSAAHQLEQAATELQVTASALAAGATFPTAPSEILMNIDRARAYVAALAEPRKGRSHAA